MRSPVTSFLSVKEVATVMHVSVATVWRYAQRGTLPAPIRIDGHTWWIEAEVFAVIEEKIAVRHNRANLSVAARTTIDHQRTNSSASTLKEAV
ncbi:hypothetical protein RFN25_18065 [Mesorhizobium abyssinicae]|uniref:helix-turn-helix transcriptional regulator n=1 Tax=Mesorhizobium abyssinicae TaxID=1209958 RepID=UPI002A247B29|nr:helix-turn-helix domain-containing protein [Mesorhizobium abyssinicae]MDX8435331.1 hypothetical protein [Mesorhizobium abyssinicae]